MKPKTKAVIPMSKRAGKWEISRSESNVIIESRYWARLRAANGEIIAWTEHYTRKANALKAIKLIQASAMAGVVDLTKKMKGAK